MPLTRANRFSGTPIFKSCSSEYAAKGSGWLVSVAETVLAGSAVVRMGTT